jgi:hypothetical protein
VPGFRRHPVQVVSELVTFLPHQIETLRQLADLPS